MIFSDAEFFSEESYDIFAPYLYIILSVSQSCLKTHKPLSLKVSWFSLSFYIFFLLFFCSHFVFYNSLCPFVNFMILCTLLLMDVVILVYQLIIQSIYPGIIVRIQWKTIILIIHPWIPRPGNRTSRKRYVRIKSSKVV